jgi:hypothetical protein
MKNPRIIEVKGLLNADEYVEFDTERAAANEQTSPLIRRLLKGWTDEQKLKRNQKQREWTGPAFYVRN